jgi:hypothetical protein
MIIAKGKEESKLEKRRCIDDKLDAVVSILGH